MKKLICTLLILAVTIPALYPQRYYPRTQLIADLDSLYKNIRETHVNMFASISKEEFEKRFNDARASVADSMTKMQFFKVASPLVAAIGDGHTEIYVPFRDFNRSNPYWLPMSVKINTSPMSLTVTGDECDEIPKGAEIVGINGRTADEIIETLLGYVSGESRPYRVNRINNSFNQWFSVIDNSEVFVVEYIFGGDTYKKEVEGITIKDYVNNLSKKRNETDVKLPPSSKFSYTLIDSVSTCLFRFDHFDYKSLEDKSLPRFLDSMFMDIMAKDIQNLIIDLRYNGGGDSRVGDLILSAISKVPFAQIGRTKARVSDQSRKRREWVRDMDDGIFESKESPDKLIRPNPKANKLIKGDVYLLTSLKTFSSASKFAWAFHHFDMGTIVGEETGGHIVSFGEAIEFQLPNTGMGYRSSWKEFYNYGATDADRHGVVPDVEVPASQALDKALEIIVSK